MRLPPRGPSCAGLARAVSARRRGRPTQQRPSFTRRWKGCASTSGCGRHASSKRARRRQRPYSADACALTDACQAGSGTARRPSKAQNDTQPDAPADENGIRRLSRKGDGDERTQRTDGCRASGSAAGSDHRRHDESGDSGRSHAHRMLHRISDTAAHGVPSGPALDDPEAVGDEDNRIAAWSVSGATMMWPAPRERSYCRRVSRTREPQVEAPHSRNSSRSR